MTRASRSSAGVAPPTCSMGRSKGPEPVLALLGMAGMLGTNCAGAAACTPQGEGAVLGQVQCFPSTSLPEAAALSSRTCCTPA